MKRKLDDNDIPSTEVSNEALSSSPNTFQSFKLDPRLLQAIAKSKFATPTPVQAKTIPFALEGKDVFAESKTGSGKTAAYAVPVIQSILRQKVSSPKTKSISAIILLPTTELADQVHKVVVTLTEFCSKEIQSVNLTQRASDAVLNAMLSGSPDIVVSTPGRIVQFLSTGSLPIGQISSLVVDEADFLFDVGCEDDMQTISKAIPRGVQRYLMSATLTPEVEELKNTLCRDPVVVKVKDKQDKGEDIKQFVVKCAEDEKFLLLFVIFKLRLIQGKCIIFVADIDRSYRVKLFLEQFGIKSCILNSELPVNSRLHVVQEFNKGLYDILIAADDQEVFGGIAKPVKRTSESALETEGGVEVLSEEDDNSNDDGPISKPVPDATNTNGATKPNKSKSKSRDYGVSRGIDFQNVSCVLNFDLPNSSKSYTHRIGRTARAGKAGMALSFVIPATQYGKHKPTSHTSSRHDERVLTRIIARQSKHNKELLPYNFNMTQVDAFRYRMNDALRAVTRVAIREARAREIKMELIRSEKLRKHFEENPDDLKHLRHQGTQGAVVRVQSHMKHVPDYLLPGKAKGGAVNGTDVGFVRLNKEGGKDRRKRKDGKRRSTSNGKRFDRKKAGGGGGKNDPLKSFRRK